jgi:hypothetical protein
VYLNDRRRHHAVIVVGVYAYRQFLRQLISVLTEEPRRELMP